MNNEGPLPIEIREEFAAWAIGKGRKNRSP